MALDKPNLDAIHGKWGESPSNIYRAIQTWYHALPGGEMLMFDPDNLETEDFRIMTEHYQISNSLSIIKYFIQQIDWYIDCPDKTQKEFLETTLKKFWSRFVNCIENSWWAGYAPAEKVFTLDKGYIVWKQWRDLKPETTLPVIDKDTQDFIGIRQWSTYWTGSQNERRRAVPNNTIMSPDIPLEYAFWYPFQMQYGYLYGRKLLRSAYMPWFFSIIMYLFTNRYYDRFSEPLIKSYAPFTQEYEYGGETMKGTEIMNAITRQLKNRTSVSFPSERDEDGNPLFDLQFMESQQRGADYEKYLLRLDSGIAKALFTPELLFGSGRVGSYNLGIEHKNTFLMMLNGFVEDFKPYLNKELHQLQDYNFGVDAPRAEFKMDMTTKWNTELAVKILTAVKDMIELKDVSNLSDYLGIDMEVRKEPITPPAPKNVKEISETVLAQYDKFKDQLARGGTHEFKLSHKGKLADYFKSQGVEIETEMIEFEKVINSIDTDKPQQVSAAFAEFIDKLTKKDHDEYRV